MPAAEFSQCPKYNQYRLTEEQLDNIANRAAIKALELGKSELKQEIGASTIAFGAGLVKNTLLLIGLLALGTIGWINPSNVHLTDFWK